MNIIDAIKSRKPITRPEKPWFTPNRNHSFSLEDVIADDWEVEEEGVLITRYQFEKAYGSTCNKTELMIALGLKP
jgi:hypothetical protein